MEKYISDKVSGFIRVIEKVKWFSNAEELSDKYTIASSFIDAWDTYNESMMAVWSKESHDLEDIAIKAIGNDSIDYVFDRIAESIGPNIEDGHVPGMENIQRGVSWLCNLE